MRLRCSLGVVTTLTVILTGLILVFTFHMAQRDFQYGQSLKERVVFEDYDPLTDCVTPFETILGYVDNVPVFSNCNRNTHTELAGYVSVHDPADTRRPFDTSEIGRIMTADIYSSMDFVIRWMIWTHGLTCHGQRQISEMWGQNNFYNPLRTARQYKAEFIDNYMTASSFEQRKYIGPRRGDVVVYSSGKESFYGHAAVIVKVEEDHSIVTDAETYRRLRHERVHPRTLYLAEQNWLNVDMGGNNYTRVISFRWRKDPLGNYEGFIVDDEVPLRIIGRMRVGKMKPIMEEVNRYEDSKVDHAKTGLSE